MSRFSLGHYNLGIEADVIMFHPYDRWGYCDMSEEQDYRFVAYIAALVLPPFHRTLRRLRFQLR